MVTVNLGYSNGANTNGVHTNGVPGPSRSPEIQSPVPSTSPVQSNGLNHHVVPIGAVNNNACLEHLYHNGFRLGHFADTVLHIQGHAYNMHALLLARSPYLAHIMSTTPLVQSNGNGPLRSIYVPIDQDPEITPETFTLAIGYLYSSVALSGINPSNARSVLAAGCLLGGMDDLCTYAYETCRSSISVETVEDWLHFIERSAPDQDPTSGSATPTSPHSPVFRGPFMAYAMKLREDFIQFLIVDLPMQLQAFSRDGSDASGSTQPSGAEALLNIYARIPFAIFKKAVESPQFEIGADQARFRFAKAAIERRKKAGGAAYIHNADETVVLAFGGIGTGGSNVHVTRKVKKRQLWKIGN